MRTMEQKLSKIRVLVEELNSISFSNRAAWTAKEKEIEKEFEPVIKHIVATKDKELATKASVLVRLFLSG